MSMKVEAAKPLTQKGVFLLQLLDECMHLNEKNAADTCALLEQAAQVCCCFALFVLLYITTHTTHRRALRFLLR